MVAHTRTHQELPAASVADTARFGLDAAWPLVAGGVLQRRPRVLALAEKFQADRRMVKLLWTLRERYGTGPVRLRVPWRSLVLLLDPHDVHRVLSESAESFTPANFEKRKALRQFQPHGVLISRGAVRAERREFNENVLDTTRQLHRLAGPINEVVRQEAAELLATAERDGRLTWQRFAEYWWRIVRRVVLGDEARDDVTVIKQLQKLRSAGNWSLLHPLRRNTRRKFEKRLRQHLGRAEQGSLAEILARTPTGTSTDPAGQVPHWLFAFDAAGIANIRTLALLTSHPAHADQAHAEIDGLDLDAPQSLPYLRACQLEAVRLWATAPAILRDSTTETDWHGQTVPSGTGFMVLSPMFHRDSRRLSYADEFDPEVWLDGRAQQEPALVPFSSGPGACPGENLVLFVGSTLLAALLENHRFPLHNHRELTPEKPLPATLNNFALEFTVERRKPREEEP
ncbi:MAG: cytochrome P450 [Pseudonocardiaceae bacterium]|nr:cytochrome P450 [Pseudonocardiaceae bacterium]